MQNFERKCKFFFTICLKEWYYFEDFELQSAILGAEIGDLPTFSHP
jgi:hypothetical protein